MEKRGLFVQRAFQLSQCARCNFISVVNPITDLSEIYNEAYYEGRAVPGLAAFHSECDDRRMPVAQRQAT